MKDKNEEGKIEEEQQYDQNIDYEFELQKARIRKIFRDTIYKLKLLSYVHVLMENNGAILRSHLSKTEADFVIYAFQESGNLPKPNFENRPDLEMMFNMIERINFNERKGSTYIKKVKSLLNIDHFELYISYALDIIFKSKSLVSYMENLTGRVDPLMVSFVESMVQLEKIVSERLDVSASEEVKKENDLKTAYRFSMMLSNNITELEEFLEKQRAELSNEHDRKEEILADLSEQIDVLKEKCKNEINRIVYESEVNMMKDYNKSVEKQAELSVEAASASSQYEMLLQENLEKEKQLRAKRLKVETQLASWIAKYDTDVGEKQAEYDQLEETFNQEKKEFDELQEKFDEQEIEYITLMKEKEEEEQRILEEKAWIFLQNRAARRIQRAWKAYKARKLARKKARKSKKKVGSAGSKKGSAGSKKGRGGSAGSKKGKGGSADSKKGKKGSADKKKGKGKGKIEKEEEHTTLKGGPDPNALLQGKFSEAILGEIKSKEAFSKHDIVVDLMEENED